MILVGLALIGGIVLLIAGGGSDNGSSSQGGNPLDRLLTHTVVNPDAGISVRRPGDWSDTKRNGVVTIQSHDKCLVLSLSAPTSKDNATTIRKQGVSYYKDNYKNVKIRSASEFDIGGVPTTSNAITVHEKGNEISVLLNVGKGKKNAYVTQVVVRSPQCQGDLQLATLMLHTIQYTK